MRQNTDMTENAKTIKTIKDKTCMINDPTLNPGAGKADNLELLHDVLPRGVVQNSSSINGLIYFISFIASGYFIGTINWYC